MGHIGQYRPGDVWLHRLGCESADDLIGKLVTVEDGDDPGEGLAYFLWVVCGLHGVAPGSKTIMGSVLLPVAHYITVYSLTPSLMSAMCSISSSFIRLEIPPLLHQAHSYQ